MMPYNSYQLYQAGRPKSTAEIRHADQQAAQFAAAVSGLFRSVTLPARVARAYRRGPQSCAAAQCTAEPAMR